MPEGYVAVLVEPGQNTPIEFWNGSIFQEEPNNAFIYPNRSDAKLALSQQYTTYMDRDIAYAPATITVNIGVVGALVQGEAKTDIPDNPEDRTEDTPNQANVVGSR